MKTLYISDLDGTLLHSNEKTSEYTNNIINSLIDKGLLFSYATARAFETSHKVTNGLKVNTPLITYNGAMIVDFTNGSLLVKNFFSNDLEDLLKDLFQNDIFPIVFSRIDNRVAFSYISSKCTPGIKTFVNNRKNDKRANPVENWAELCKGEIFYITCIDEKSKLSPVWEKYKNLYNCFLQTNLYSKDEWLEIMPKCASKANAINQLKEYLSCDRVVVFGDGKNDIEMFKIADESYAVGNAVDELKSIATGIIEDNDSDGVAKWLYNNTNFESNYRQKPIV